MDLVKFAAVLVTSDQRLPEISGPNRAPKRRVALAQIPTAAGSGSTWRFAPTDCRARPGGLGEEAHAIRRPLDFNPVGLSEADILGIYDLLTDFELSGHPAPRKTRHGEDHDQGSFRRSRHLLQR